MWSLMTGIGWQSNVDGLVGGEKKLLRTLPEASRLTKSFHTYFFIYIPRVSDLPFRPFCFRALKTLGTETPANPDVSFFFIYCTDNQEYFSKYALRKLKMIRLLPTLMGLVLFTFPCLLLATLLLRCESDC